MRHNSVHVLTQALLTCTDSSEMRQIEPAGMVGDEVDGEAGEGAGPSPKQILHPVDSPLVSLVHVIASPALTATPLGPVLPWYSTPPSVSLSNPLSVLKPSTASVPTASALMLQASLAP